MQRSTQSALIDESAAPGVDEDRAGLHRREGVGVDEVTGRRRQRRVERHDVGRGKQGDQVVVAAGTNQMLLRLGTLHSTGWFAVVMGAIAIVAATLPSFLRTDRTVRSDVR